MRTNYGNVSSLLYYIQEIDFSLSREQGLDIAMMKSIIDFSLRHHLYPPSNPDSGFINLNNQYWLKISMEFILTMIPLWSREKAIYLFEYLVDLGLITVNGDINKGEVLILLEE